MSFVSIITTTYKHQEFIADTINSILSQKYKDRELLIGDDSPDDETWNIIQSYVEKYPDKIKARHHNPNKWIVENTNFLLSQINSQSEYVAFLEWDDLYTPDNLLEKIKIFDKYDDIAIVYNDISFINKDNEIILQSLFSQRNIQYYKNEIIPIEKYVLSKAWPICSWSSGMFRKKYLNQYTINNVLPEKKSYSVSDRDIYFQISTQHKIYYINKQLTKYRRHSDNLSAIGSWTSDDMKILLQYYLDNWLISYPLFSKKYSRLNIVSCIFALEKWQKTQSIKYLKDSFIYDFGYSIWYKIFCIFLIVLPIEITKYILSKLIKRW